MARSQSKKQSSLAALAAGLDTRKKPLPADAKGQDSALRAPAAKEAVTARLAEKAPPPKPVAKPVAAKPEPKSPSITERLAAKPVETKPVISKPVAVTRPEPKPPSIAERLAAKPAPVRAPEPVRAPSRPVESSVSRSTALASLARTPAAPVKPPVAAKPTSRPAPAHDSRRRYPRANVDVRTRLSLADDPSRVFEATLPTVNISVGGMFLESTFFLKMGTKLLVELKLPPKGRSVHVKAEVVRIETNAEGSSGFALRFNEYLDGSEVVLATHFLSPVLKEFITAYAKQHRFDASAEYIAHTADVLAAWELKKAELGGDVWSLTALS